MICVAIGCPDDSFPAYLVVSERKPVSELASFRGFQINDQGSVIGYSYSSQSSAVSF